MADEFSVIYAKNRWGIGSGSGSSPVYCAQYISYLQGILSNHSHVLDLGCGDWSFSQLIDWTCPYLGVDVVQSVLEKCSQSYKSPGVEFTTVDFQDPVNVRRLVDNNPVDLIIVKDVFQHWTDSEVIKFMDCLVGLPKWRTLIIINNWRFTRDKSKNGQPRNLSNRYRWAPIDYRKYPLHKYGFAEVMYYPRGRFKQVARLDRK